jgi:putative transposase
MRHDAGYAPGTAGVLADNGIAISMSGCGAASNMRVYLRAYDGVGEARVSISRYRKFYNIRRPRSSLDGTTADQAYFAPLPIRVAA